MALASGSRQPTSAATKKENAMRTSIRLAGLGLAGTALLTSALAASAAPTESRTRAAETIVFATPWDGGQLNYVDLGAKGVGPGDLFLITGLPMRADGKRIGTMEAVETILSARHDGTVGLQVTLRLPGGNVMIDGIGRHTDQPFRLAVVGGTGKYSNVRGQLVLVREDEERKVTIERLVIRW
jgi:hypothetical protein